MSYVVAVYILTLGSLVGYGIGLLTERAALLSDEGDEANGKQ